MSNENMFPNRIFFVHLFEQANSVQINKDFFKWIQFMGATKIDPALNMERTMLEYAVKINCTKTWNDVRLS